MDKFFKRPSVELIVQQIYSYVIQTHETGGSSCRYELPKYVSTAFIDEIICRLNDLLLDADVIDHKNNIIMIDWS
jgi:hypothetical protein